MNFSITVGEKRTDTWESSHKKLAMCKHVDEIVQSRRLSRQNAKGLKYNPRKCNLSHLRWKYTKKKWDKFDCEQLFNFFAYQNKIKDKDLLWFVTWMNID